MTTQPTRAMDQLGSQDMAVPEIKLIQNVGGDQAREAGAKPGDFYVPVTGTIIPGDSGFHATIVDMQKTRTYWGRTDISDEPPLCASASADSEMSMDGKDCRTCEFRSDAPWALSTAERREKCTHSYNVLVLLHGAAPRPGAPQDELTFTLVPRGQGEDPGFPALVRAAGLGTKAVRELLTQLRLNPRLKGEIHRAVVKVVSIRRKTVSGDAYALDFRIADILGTEDPRSKLLLEQSIIVLGVGLGAIEAPATLPAPKAPAPPTPVLDLGF